LVIALYLARNVSFKPFASSTTASTTRSRPLPTTPWDEFRSAPSDLLLLSLLPPPNKASTIFPAPPFDACLDFEYDIFVNFAVTNGGWCEYGDPPLKRVTTVKSSWSCAANRSIAENIPPFLWLGKPEKTKMSVKVNKLFSSRRKQKVCSKSNEWNGKVPSVRRTKKREEGEKGRNCLDAWSIDRSESKPGEKIMIHHKQ
jgi:hypothetical protein